MSPPVPPEMLADKDLIQLAIDQSAAIQIYWNAYFAISVGLLSLLASGKLFKPTLTLKIVFTIAFVVFVAGNFDAIQQINERRIAICELVQASYLQGLVNLLRPDSAWKYAAVHGVLDAAVILAIWIINAPPDQEKA